MFKRKFNPVFLLFFLIPLIFFFLFQRHENKQLPEIDFLFFSAFSSKPTEICLFSGDELLTTWHLDADCFKYFDYSGSLVNSKHIYLKIKNLNKNDTISFLSINIYRNNRVNSLFHFINPDEYISNAQVINNKDIIMLVVEDENKPITLSLRPSDAWQRTNTQGRFIVLLELLFLFIFILLHIISPSKRYFIFSLLLCISLMFLFKSIISHRTADVKIKTKSGLQKADIFYNHYPQFSHLKTNPVYKTRNVLETSVDIKPNSFIRFDSELVPEFKDIQFIIHYGIFSKRWTIDNSILSKLSINDLSIKDDVFIIKGNDPFISFTSDYFNSGIKWLILINDSVFLFLSLLVFVILLLLYYKIASYIKMDFHPTYLLFLTIPFAYYILNNHTSNTVPKKPLKDYFYYTAKSSYPVIVSLHTEEDSITAWALNKRGFKFFDCLCNIQDTSGIILKINHLPAHHAVSFLAFNFFRDNMLYTLHDKTNPYCIVENGLTHIKNDVLTITAINPGEPVLIRLYKTSAWQSLNEEERPAFLVIFLFILAFLVILILKPSVRYFITALVLTLFILCLYGWLGTDIQDQVTIRTSTPQRSVESYFSKTPLFNTDDKFPSKTYLTFFRTQVELGKNRYIRCDIDDTLKHVNNLEIAVRTGLLIKKFKLTSTDLGKLVLNDLDYNNGTFYVTGNDPFFALTSTHFVDSVIQLTSMRNNAYLFITLFIFLILIIIHKRVSAFNPIGFILCIVFLSVITSGLLYTFFNSERVRLKAEKRDVEPLMKFDTDSVKEFTLSLNTYLNDQVTARNKIIPLNNYIYYSLFGELLNNPDVYFGKDGWMFYVGANGRETYENREPVTDEELRTIKQIFEERRDWLKEKGIELYIVIPKISQFIYEEMLGKRMFRYNKTSKLEQLTTYLKDNSDIKIIDVEKPIMEAKSLSKAALYYKSSTHWNYYGAYFAYAAIIKYIQQDFPDIGDPIPLKEIKMRCSIELEKDIDLIEMAALVGYLRGYELVPEHPDLYAGDTIEPLFPNGKPDFPTLYIRNNKKQGPHMLMFRDSYARQLYPYMSHHFNRSAYLWTNTFTPELIEQEKPDLVIWEMSERFIPFFVIYKNPLFDSKKQP